MVRVHRVRGRHALQQLQLDGQRRFARRQPGAVADAEDVRVHRHRRLAKGHVQHHVGGLAAHAGQRLKLGAGAGHLAAVPLDQDAAGLQQMARFAAKQADGLDVALQPVLPQRQDLLRRVGHREKPPRGLVHPRVRRLGGKQHGRQQLEHAAVFQLALRVRVGRLQGGEEMVDLLGGHRGWGGAPARVGGLAAILPRCGDSLRWRFPR